MHIFNLSFNGRTAMDWLERNLFFILCWSFLHCWVWFGFVLFLSDTVNFGSVHGRKCKSQVLCTSLCLLSKVCYCHHRSAFLSGTLIKICPNKWESVVKEQSRSSDNLSVTQSGKTEILLIKSFFSVISGVLFALIHGNFSGRLWFLN